MLLKRGGGVWRERVPRTAQSRLVCSKFIVQLAVATSDRLCCMNKGQNKSDLPPDCKNTLQVLNISTMGAQTPAEL